MELVYWVILLFWVALIWYLKKDSDFSLKTALVLFFIAAVLTVFGIRNIAEQVMRISFIGWLVGIFQALIECKRSRGYNHS